MTSPAAPLPPLIGLSAGKDSIQGARTALVAYMVAAAASGGQPAADSAAAVVAARIAGALDGQGGFASQLCLLYVVNDLLTRASAVLRTPQNAAAAEVASLGALVRELSPRLPALLNAVTVAAVAQGGPGGADTDASVLKVTSLASLWRERLGPRRAVPSSSGGGKPQQQHHHLFDEDECARMEHAAACRIPLPQITDAGGLGTAVGAGHASAAAGVESQAAPSSAHYAHSSWQQQPWQCQQQGDYQQYQQPTQQQQQQQHLYQSYEHAPMPLPPQPPSYHQPDATPLFLCPQQPQPPVPPYAQWQPQQQQLYEQGAPQFLPPQPPAPPAYPFIAVAAPESLHPAPPRPTASRFHDAPPPQQPIAAQPGAGSQSGSGGGNAMIAAAVAAASLAAARFSILPGGPGSGADGGVPPPPQQHHFQHQLQAQQALPLPPVPPYPIPHQPAYPGHPPQPPGTLAPGVLLSPAPSPGAPVFSPPTAPAFPAPRPFAAAAPGGVGPAEHHALRAGGGGLDYAMHAAMAASSIFASTSSADGASMPAYASGQQQLQPPFYCSGDRGGDRGGSSSGGGGMLAVGSGVDLSRVPVGLLVNLVKAFMATAEGAAAASAAAAAATGGGKGGTIPPLAAYTPLHAGALGAGRAPAVEPGRLQVRVTQLVRRIQGLQAEYRRKGAAGGDPDPAGSPEAAAAAATSDGGNTRNTRAAVGNATGLQWGGGRRSPSRSPSPRGGGGREDRDSRGGGRAETGVPRERGHSSSRDAAPRGQRDLEGAPLPGGYRDERYGPGYLRRFKDAPYPRSAAEAIARRMAAAEEAAAGVGGEGAAAAVPSTQGTGTGAGGPARRGHKRDRAEEDGHVGLGFS